MLLNSHGLKIILKIIFEFEGASEVVGFVLSRADTAGQPEVLTDRPVGGQCDCVRQPSESSVAQVPFW